MRQPLRQRLEAFWRGERPQVIPYTIYWWEWHGVATDPAWAPMYEAGLGYTQHVATVKDETPGLEVKVHERQDGAVRVRETVCHTPVGAVSQIYHDSWPQNYPLRCAEDYRVFTWIVEHTRLAPDFDQFLELERTIAPHGIALAFAGRTPLQRILVDLCGLEAFAEHQVDLYESMMTLYHALFEQLRRRVALMAQGPGTFVAFLENLSVDTLGPRRYEQFHLPVYRELIPVLQRAGKVVGVHYDGQTAAIARQIAAAPMDIIESLTPPPEGDMTLTQARAAWPNKGFWTNINVSLYNLPPRELREAVLALVEQAGNDGRGLAFQVSEHLPRNWRQSMPVVLEALEETRRAAAPT